jgi:hypothetical protein
MPYIACSVQKALRMSRRPLQGERGASCAHDVLEKLLKAMPEEERDVHVVRPPRCALGAHLPRGGAAALWGAASGAGRGAWRPGQLLVHLDGWAPQQVRLISMS